MLAVLVSFQNFISLNREGSGSYHLRVRWTTRAGGSAFGAGAGFGEGSSTLTVGSCGSAGASCGGGVGFGLGG